MKMKKQISLTEYRILIKPETRERLIGISRKDETFDEIINKLLDHYHNFTIKGNKKR